MKLRLVMRNHVKTYPEQVSKYNTIAGHCIQNHRTQSVCRLDNGHCNIYPNLYLDILDLGNLVHL